MTAAELKKKLTVDPKLPDEAVVNICAKHLRVLSLDDELEIESSVPDWRPIAVSAGTVRKALGTKPKSDAAKKKADAEAKRKAAAEKKKADEEAKGKQAGEAD